MSHRRGVQFLRPPAFHSERDIFNFVGLTYKEPAERTGAGAVVLV